MFFKIKDYGTQIPSGDTGYTLANLDFNFSYFGSVYSQVSININGYVCLGNNNQCFADIRPTP